MIADDIDTLDAQQLRDALRAARAEAAFKQAVIDKLTHENAGEVVASGTARLVEHYIAEYETRIGLA